MVNNLKDIAQGVPELEDMWTLSGIHYHKLFFVLSGRKVVWSMNTPIQLTVSESVGLRLYGQRYNDTIEDLTEMAKISCSNEIGQIQNGILIAKQPGFAYISASSVKECADLVLTPILDLIVSPR